jgi:glucose-1-phosphate thymidylyltransferase
VEIARNIAPSPRGEYEITDVNRVYLEQGRLQVGIMNRGTAWLDTGTFDSFADACEFVRVIEKRQSQKIGCIEEVAYRMGFIDEQQLFQLADKYAKSGYGEYLRRIKK